MTPGSLIVCGTGTTSVAQVTLEVLGHIRDAERLLYLASDPLTERWLLEQRPDAESLVSSYGVGKPRSQTYAEVVERILAPVRAGSRVCAIFYGHPGVAVEAGHRAVRTGRLEGYEARMLPGISAEACLYADLGVDPVARGCVSREATDLVLGAQSIDPTLDLVVWQIGLIGHLDYQERFGLQGVPLLVERLLEAHPPAHEVTIYEAASFAFGRPRIDAVALRDLAGAELSGFSTLYVPASRDAVYDPERRARLAALCGRG
jgi:uncharacterized protein YabN with tetrapyrrole methylase and pyrophosphatase domain